MSGRDVWRISRAMAVAPWSFLIYFQSPEPRPDTFILDASGRHFRLALSKQPASKRRKSPPPCIFLMRTRNGHHRCGLGDLRPDVCKTFPIEMVGGVLCIPGETGCACRTWSLADVNLKEEAPLVGVRYDSFIEYAEIVEQWNSQVHAAPEDAQFSFFDYCDYLLQAYDALDARQTPSPAHNQSEMAAGGAQG